MTELAGSGRDAPPGYRRSAALPRRTACGQRGKALAVWFKPVPFSAEWNYDPAPQWRCPVCGCCLGDAPYARL